MYLKKSQENQGDSLNNTNQQDSTSTSTVNNAGSGSETSSIKATPAMVRCSTIMKMQKDIHTTVVSCLEGIADQVSETFLLKIQ